MEKDLQEVTEQNVSVMQNGEIAENSTNKKKNKQMSLVRLTLVALFAALTAAGAFVTVPVGIVPIVLQNMFAMLSGLLLGPVMGALAVLLYLVAGALGAPVFAGGAGGLANFLAPSGGFLYGYLLAALVAGLVCGRPRPARKTAIWRIAIAAVAGMLIIYVPGVLQLKVLYAMSWKAAFFAGFVPFIPGDIFKTFAAVLVAPRLRGLIGDVIGK